MAQRILLVDDEVSVLKSVRAYLEREGFVVATAEDGLTALQLAQSFQPNLIILDVMLPGQDGFGVLRTIRRDSEVYVLMLTASAGEIDRVVGLELGADDYLTKPFSPRELVARVRSAIRRLETQAEQAPVQVLAVGTLRLDPTYRTVILGGEPVELTSTEFDLLYYFMRHPDRPFTRTELLAVTQEDIFGDASAYERTIDAHIKNLRQKLGGAGRHSRFIETVHGIGYRFVPPALSGIG